jgi:predicted negative regulator of RcsB-dependent stress response
MPRTRRCSARGYGLQTVAMARRDGGHYARIVTQGSLGEVLVLAGEFDGAEKALLDTIEQASEHGFRAVELRTRHNLGELRSAQGRHDEAVQVLAEVLCVAPSPAREQP